MNGQSGCLLIFEYFSKDITNFERQWKITLIQHKIFYKVADVESLVSYVGLKRKEKILRDKNNLNK